MVIEDLLSAPDLRRYAAQPEMDPLTEEDALQEAQLLDVRFDVLRSTVGLLFELRTALQLREANTGVLVAHGVREFTWSAAPRSTGKTAWNVVGSVPHVASRLFELDLSIFPKGRLRLVAEGAEFYVGDAAGLADTPPDYSEDNDATIRAGLAGWHSEFSPMHAVFLDPISSDC
jgi:hypothetical protein